jgi:hypothetical protein
VAYVVEGGFAAAAFHGYVYYRPPLPCVASGLWCAPSGCSHGETSRSVSGIYGVFRTDLERSIQAALEHSRKGTEYNSAIQYADNVRALYWA